jgi:hypothetical protein
MASANASLFWRTLSNVTTATPGCERDCIPDGFWALFGTAVTLLVVMMLLLAWAASPRQCGACCCSIGRGFGDIWRGAQQTLLEANGRRRGGGRRQGRQEQQEQEGIEEEEDWWEVKPQTEQEMKVFKRQKEEAE